MKKRSLFYFWVAVLPFVLDRVTKFLMMRVCAQLPYVVCPILTIDCSFNRGVSWGVLHAAATWQFVAVSVLISCIAAGLCVYVYQRYRDGFAIYGELLVISGALSNLVDRVLYGGVLDFINVSWHGWSWPAFNFADMSIVVGIIIMAWSLRSST